MIVSLILRQLFSREKMRRRMIIIVFVAIFKHFLLL